MFMFPGAPGANNDLTKTIKTELERAESKAAKDRAENMKGLHERTAAEQLRTNPSPGYAAARLIELLKDRTVSVRMLASALNNVTEWMHRRAHGDAVASAIHTDDDVIAAVRFAWARIHSALKAHQETEYAVWDEIEFGCAALHTPEGAEHGRRPHVPDAVDVCMRALRARDQQEIK